MQKLLKKLLERTAAWSRNRERSRLRAELEQIRYWREYGEARTETILRRLERLASHDRAAKGDRRWPVPNYTFLSGHVDALPKKGTSDRRFWALDRGFYNPADYGESDK